ncbi:unnamed protein product [Parnassius mnemosyne]|uniref:Ionotropic receptor 75a N-terminal domain-containing protein n=1 Tax=Parnassius mnemosyne TaxID=213953 RepID=A0AAV1LLN1_9NEOP
MNFLTIKALEIMFLIINIKEALSASEKEMQIIIDVVNSYEKPTDVVAIVCWRKYLKFSFVNKLRKLEKPKRVLFITKHEVCENKLPSKNLIFITDTRCPNIKDILFNANSCNKFNNPNRWIILGNMLIKNNEITHDFTNLNIMIDSEVILLQLYAKIFKLYMPYKIGPKNNGWIIESFATWDPIHGLNKSKEIDIATSVRRKDLSREPITMSVVVTENMTKSELPEIRNIHRDTLAKSSFLHYMPIYDFTNATMAIIYAETWGYLLNGTWNGMVGDVAQGKAEFAGTVMFITKERLPVLEYMNSPSSTSVKFVFREPSLSYENNLFLLPFKPVVWYCIVGLVFLLMFILFINARWENVKSCNKNKIDHTILQPNVSDIAIMVISAISQQGSSTELKGQYILKCTARFSTVLPRLTLYLDATGSLGRVVMFILFFTFVFLYTSYSASIVALLQSTSNQIRTLSDLLNSKLELGAEDIVYNRYLFSTATEPVKKAIYQNKIAPRGSKANFMKLEDGVRKLQKEPFAFNMNTGLGYRLVEQYFYEHEKCGLREISYFVNNKPWQTCRKDSPYKEIFKIGSFRSQEHGFNVRINKIVYSKKPICIAKGGKFGSVNMTDFYPALLTLLYGIISALVILLFEILVHRKQFKGKS